MLFGEMKLPLYLRGDREFFGGHQKKGRTIGGPLEQENSSISPNTTVFLDEESYWETAGDAIRWHLVRVFYFSSAKSPSMSCQGNMLVEDQFSC
jgi:hypothetical protein